ncbi:MAG: hypothetical protein WCG80_10835 [Spirochaetales bacterium]
MKNSIRIQTLPEGGLDIQLQVPADQQGMVLERFERCQNGTCDCKTTEYDKLAQFDLSATGTLVSLRLTPKPGEAFNPAEVERCLITNLAPAESSRNTPAPEVPTATS